MMLLTWLVIVLLAEPKPEPVELKTPTGTIYGVLDLPATPGPWPVIIFHAGSGPTDRDGNNPAMKMNSSRMLGEQLAERGFAVLRFDKRGIAASAAALGKPEEITIDHYVDDAIAWTELLRKDKRFTKVGFIGHSEGSVIGVKAAARAKFDALVSLCGPGRPFDELIVEQIGKDSKELAGKSAEILAAIKKGEEPAEIPKPLAALFRKNVYVFLRSVMAKDPAEEFAKVTCPALILSGATDIQVAEADAKALAKANPNAKFVRLDAMNHVLKEIESTNKLAQVANTYMDPKKPLHPKLIGTLTDFFTEAFRAK